MTPTASVKLTATNPAEESCESNKLSAFSGV